MARMPGAIWKPLPRPSTTRMSRYDLVVLHTCVGSLEGTYSYFRNLTNGVNSHFLTGGYGENWQLVDTAVRSGANGAGNHRAITVENADMGPGFAPWDIRDASQVPAFTAAQIETNARICAWAHREHGVPLVAADTSLPTARGVGFHRLGCDPFRVAGGELWSSSYGKLCPAPRRIAQIPQIIARARQIVGGAPTGGLLMALSDAEQAEVLEYVREHRVGIAGQQKAGPAGLIHHRIENRLKTVETLARTAAANAGTDVTKLAEALRPTIEAAVLAGVQLDNESQADAIVDELVQRLARSS